MPVSKLHAVESSCIARIGYDPARKEVYVEFLDSGLYAYRDVQPSVYDEFAKAESKGTFVNEVIKPRYRYRKL